MPLLAEKAGSMSYMTKPVPDGDIDPGDIDPGDIDPKVRNCLACRRPFESAWAGERICPKCKSSSSWRTGSAFQYPAAKRS